MSFDAAPATVRGGVADIFWIAYACAIAPRFGTGTESTLRKGDSFLIGADDGACLTDCVPTRKVPVGLILLIAILIGMSVSANGNKVNQHNYG